MKFAFDFARRKALARRAAVLAAAVAVAGASPAGSAEVADAPVATAGPVAALAAAPLKIAFIAPIRGFAINSRFGLRRLPTETAPRQHRGVDFAAPLGSPILSAAPGQIVDTGYSPSYGNYVEVEHPNGVSSFYAHMSRTAGLRVGSKVNTGVTLGYVGSTGRSTGPHLHFEIRRGEARLNPEAYIGREFEVLTGQEGSINLVSAARPSGAPYQILHRGG